MVAQSVKNRPIWLHCWCREWFFLFFFGWILRKLRSIETSSSSLADSKIISNREESFKKVKPIALTKRSLSRNIKSSLGGSPGLVVMGFDSCCESCGFKSQCHIGTGWTFTQLLVVKIAMLVWIDENDLKRGWGLPIYKTIHSSSLKLLKVFIVALIHFNACQLAFLWLMLASTSFYTNIPLITPCTPLLLIDAVNQGNWSLSIQWRLECFVIVA